MAKLGKALVRVDGIGEVRFGEKDRIVAVPIDGDATRGWTFVGRTGRTFTAPVADYPADIVRALVAHGSKQKLKDGTGDLDDEAEMFGYIEKSHAMLAAGTFRGTGGGGGFDSDLVAVLVEATGQSDAEVRATLKTLSAAEREILRQEEGIRSRIEARVAKRTAGTSLSDVLKKVGL